MNLQEIPISLIDDTDRVRQDLGEIDDLAESIRVGGLIQPISVQPHPDPEGDFKYRLIAGGRRLAAHRILKADLIPAVIKEVEDDLTVRELELVENLQRKDFNWYERIEAVYAIDQELRTRHKGDSKKGGSLGWAIRDTAKVLNRSHGGVGRQLTLYKEISILPDVLQEQVRGQENEDQAVQLVRRIGEELSSIRTRQAQHEELEGELADETQLQHGVPRPDEGAPIDGAALRKDILARAESWYRVGDAFEGLAEIAERRAAGAENIIGLFEIDPPYGIDLLDKKKGDDTKRNEYNEVPADEYVAWLKRLCESVYAAAPRNCHVVFWYGHQWYADVKAALTEAGFSVDPIPCMWIKSSGQTNNPDKFLARAHEPFLHATKGEPLLFKRGRVNWFAHPVVPQARKIHPTQRPLELIKDLYETFTLEKQLVVSPFLGSGASIIAGLESGRPVLGWDLSQAYKDKFMSLGVERLIRELLGEATDDSGLNPVPPDEVDVGGGVDLVEALREEMEDE